MKYPLIAAAIALAATAPGMAAEQASTTTMQQQPVASGSDPDGRQALNNPNGPGVPPGDGITARGADPEGQAFTPPGYNNAIAMNVYPPTAVAPAGLIGGTYPVCTKQVTDRCVQAYSKYTRRARR